MKINNAGLDLIKKYEGCKLNVYLCPAGVKTVGYGHTGNDVNLMSIGQKITQQLADTYLLMDIQKFEKKVDKYDSTYHWTENEFSSLVSFAFNLGSIDQLTNKGLRSKDEIAEKMLLYVNANGKPLDGLKRRRAEERALFLSGKSDASISKTETVDQNPENFPLIKKGSTGFYVEVAQTALNYNAGRVILDVTGTFDSRMQNAVIEFQASHKDKNGKQLVKDGIIGKKSWWALMNI